MITWYSISLILICVLLTILVIRVAEVSTRIHTLEQVARRISETHSTIHAKLEDTITPKELRTILGCSTRYFTVGTEKDTNSKKK
jgi:hypothetical protein